jgi:hypothetical protein
MTRRLTFISEELVGAVEANKRHSENQNKNTVWQNAEQFVALKLGTYCTCMPTNGPKSV